MTEISNEYATALFALALEQQILDEVNGDLDIVTHELREQPAYLELLASPSLPKKQRAQLFAEAFLPTIGALSANFVQLLCEQGQIRAIFDCVESYKELYQTYRHVSIAEVVSAVPLTDAEKERLKSSLERRLQSSVTLQCSVNPEILGGVIVSVLGTVMDGSLKRQIEELKEVMAQ